MRHTFTSHNAGGWQDWHDMQIDYLENDQYKAEQKAEQEEKLWTEHNRKGKPNDPV